MGFSRYGTPLLSMMSNERDTYLLTLSPLPNGDMLNSTRTMRFLSCLRFGLAAYAGARTRPTLRNPFSPTDPPIASQSISRDVRLAHAHPPTPRRSFVTRPAHRLLRNRFPGTRL